MARETFYYNRGNRPLNSGAVIGLSQDVVNFTGTGDKILVAAVAGRKIHLLKLLIVGAGATNARFYSGPSAENAPIGGQLNFAGPWSLVLDYDDFDIVTDSSKGLILTSSVDVQVGGWIKYWIE